MNHACTFSNPNETHIPLHILQKIEEHESLMAALRSEESILLQNPQLIAQAKELNARLLYWELQYGISRLSSFPLSIDLPVAGKCNLRCTMCGLSNGDPQHPNWTLAQVQEFDKLIRFAKNVNTTGPGEPLLVKDIIPIFEYLAQYGIRPTFYTNATKMTPSVADKLIELNSYCINISVDGATKKTFETIRRFANYDTVIENIRYLIQKRNSLGRKEPHVRIAMVLMLENLHEASSLVQLASDLGADCVYFGFVSALVPDKMVQNDPLRTNQALDEARAVARKCGIPLQAPDNLPISPKQTEEATASPESPVPAVSCTNGPAGPVYCHYPWTQMTVWSDGAISPCCAIRDEVDGKKFGNINEAPPQTLWNSEGMVRLRELLAEGRPPKACQVCTIRQAFHKNHRTLL